MRPAIRVYLACLILLTLITIPLPLPSFLISGTTTGASARELAAFLDHTPTSPQRATVLGYQREEFGPGWATLPSGCTVREQLLVKHFSLHDDIPSELSQPGCVSSLSALDPAVVIPDPYTGEDLVRADVEIDHVVPLSAAWDMGAYAWDAQTRHAFANDPANLVVTSRAANQEKSDQLPSQWLPPDKRARCKYVTTLAHVAYRYSLALPANDKTVMRKQCRMSIGEWLLLS
ncbi:HNH endonuclease family protein [Corynebacterium cystitidis]|uniref:HNH endonuclease family protein n=1 Tax=Corynebacterium cystitidis TaxID=35757 RepID=UPI00211E9DC6|nr:HNH endonuclease family protein [Corynebacterium cystitidis]